MITDVVVIGGGIIGCSCAYYLSKLGMKVHLVEKGAIGSGASKAGMCHIVTWEEPDIHLKLELASKRLYDDLRTELPFGIDYQPTGSLALVENEETMAAMNAMIVRLRAAGHHCEPLAVQDLTRMEPNLAPGLAGGAYFADDVQVNPLKATIALAQAARQTGAIIEPFSEVTGIEIAKQGGHVEAVLTRSGRIPTGGVVNAAGAWAGAVGKMANLEIPITPRKGHLALTAPMPAELLRNKTLFSAGYLNAVKGGDGLAVACNIQQTMNGNLLLGSSRQFVGFDTRVDPKVLSAMLQISVRFFPFLANANVIRTWAGLRPYTPDILPIICEAETVRRYFIAAGHEGLGITEGPITGKLIAQLVTSQTPEISLELLSLSRFMREDR